MSDSDDWYNLTGLTALPESYLNEDIGYRLINVAVAFIVLQSVFIVLFYLSRNLNKTLKGWDCYLFMPMAYIGSMGVCIIAIAMVKWGGTGRHVETLLLEDPSMITTKMKLEKAMEFVTYISITGPKLATLSLYLRVFAEPVYQITTYLVGTVVVLNWFIALILSLTICRPISYYWNTSGAGGHCGNILAFYRYICVPNIATDVIMLLLPLPALYKLHLNLPTKIGLFMTFLVASAGIITSILRFVSFFIRNELVTDPHDDYLNVSCVIAESGTYLIAASMLSLRPLKRRIFPNHSFTRLLDLGLQKLSIRTASDAVPSFVRKRSVSGYEERPMESGNSASQEVDLESASSTRLNDVGGLLPQNHGGTSVG